MFAQHSWYFRNALVRANYQNVTQQIYSTDIFLVRFLSNILQNQNHQFRNRDMHVLYTSSGNDKKGVGVKKDIVENLRKNPSLTTQ